MRLLGDDVIIVNGENIKYYKITLKIVDNNLKDFLTLLYKLRMKYLFM